MKFALSLDHRDWTRGDPAAAIARTVALAKLADRAGIDSLWLNEDPEGWDAFSVLGALANVTERVRLGTGVTNAFHRHPNLIAASVSTVDRLSSGRAFLGIGRGQPEWYSQALGIPGYSPLGLLEETVSLLHQWWGTSRTAAADGPIAVRDWERAIAPVGYPPIYVAAAGPNALDLAGRVADGVLFNELASVDYLRRAIQGVKTAATSAGRDPETLSFFVNPAIAVTDDPTPILERKKGFLATVHVLPGMDVLLETPDFDVAGIVARVREAMRTEEILKSGGGFVAMRREGDFAEAKKAIPTELIDRLAAVGPIEKVRERIASYREVGATHLFLDRTSVPPDQEQLRMLLYQLGAD